MVGRQPVDRRVTIGIPAAPYDEARSEPASASELERPLRPGSAHSALGPARENKPPYQPQGAEVRRAKSRRPGGRNVKKVPPNATVKSTYGTTPAVNWAIAPHEAAARL